MEALRSPVARIRANPWLAVGIAAFALLTAAWIGWAVYVASDRGVNEGLGVLIAWPALLIVVGIVSLPFVGGYLLVKRLGSGSDDEPAGESEDDADQDDESKGDADEESEPEPEAAAS